MSYVPMVNEKSKRLAVFWLVMAGVVLVLWLVLWLMGSTPKALANASKQEVTAQDFELPKSIDALGELDKEVKPVDFSTVIRDLRHYPAEFKDKKFFEDHAKKWTVQVMDVAQNDIITGYLKGRKDRDAFNYFRYRTKSGEQRFILTYGLMSSNDDATAKMSQVNFGLPNNIKPTIQKIDEYLPLIDNYTRSEPVVDSSPQAPRAVKLQATKKELPAAPPKPKEKEETPKEKSAEDVAAELDKKQQERAKQAKIQRETQEKLDNEVLWLGGDPNQAPKPQDEPQKSQNKNRQEPRANQGDGEKNNAVPMTNTPSIPGSDD